MYTPIEIDKTRNLRYGYRGLSLIEDGLGKPLASVDFNNASIREVITIVWAGLVHEDKDLTVDDLMDKLDESGVKMDYLVDKMTEALNEAFSDDNSAVGAKKKTPAKKSQKK